MAFARGLLAASIVALAAMSAQAQQTPEQFWKGSTLRIMLGHPPGGSYDFYARLAADHMRQYIPGAPAIIVESKPGGGGIVATAFFYAQAPRDGSTIALFPETIAHTQLLEPSVGKWKVQEMSYIGSFAPVNTAFVFRKGAAAKTTGEMRKLKTVAGCTGKNSQSYQYPAMLKALGGFQFDIICGYKGSADSILAMERGEVDFVSSAWNSWRATHKQPIAEGLLLPLIQGGLRRNKEMPDVPLMQELLDDPEARKVVEFASAGAAIGRALIAPPGAPADRLAALRKAFDEMVADPKFIADAARRNLELETTPGVEVQKIAADILSAPPEIVAKAAKAMD
ncbi:MAG: Tripartite-type tricarboxylate transporter, receptor component TctC [Hyphomicrobiales bacterium]|nr:Tripartite-type tricarboxylate transporter, receptor component TctC [Hyphomicrobiales bacterium]